MKGLPYRIESSFQLVGGTGVGRSPCGTGFTAEGMFRYPILFLLLLKKHKIFHKTEIAVFRWPVGSHHIIGKANSMLFFFPLIHSIKFAQHDMQHTCSAQLSS
jgi:hypothetical protein